MSGESKENEMSEEEGGLCGSFSISLSVPCNPIVKWSVVSLTNDRKGDLHLKINFVKYIELLREECMSIATTVTVSS